MTAYPRPLRFLSLLLALLTVSTSVVLSAAADGEYLPPSVSVSPPDTSGCPYARLPVAPIDTSEAVAPGLTSPAPLPVPDPPVGIPVNSCGFLLPTDATAIPSDISASAWVVADLDSGEILGAKDIHGRYRPASTLKLLTALTMLQNLPDLTQVIVGTDEDSRQEGSRVGIGEGGQYTVAQLLLFMMMGSGNDTAFALSRTNGGFDKTVADMNAVAASLGAQDTRAVTVSGLDGPGQMTSVYDLGLIIRAAMANPAFPPLISTPYSQVPGFAGEPAFGIANDNDLLLHYPGALGGKTGFTDDAGNTYVGLAERDGRRLLVTMLGGTQQPRRQWMQAGSLLDWGFSVAAGTPSVGRLINSASEIGAPASQTPPVAATGPGQASMSASPAVSEPAGTVATGSFAAGSYAAGAATGNPGITGSSNPGSSQNRLIPTPSTISSLFWVILSGVVVLVVGIGLLVFARRRSVPASAATDISGT